MLRSELYTPWFSGKDDWGFEIIDGEFSGVVVQVNKVVFKDEDEKGNNLQVDYHVIHKPEILNEEHVKGELFEALFQTIIVDIIKEAVESYEHKNDGNNNTEESDSQ